MANLQAADKLPPRAAQRAPDLPALLGARRERSTLSGLARVTQSGALAVEEARGAAPELGAPRRRQ